MTTTNKLYNALAYLVLLVRQLRTDLGNPSLTQMNLEDLDFALEKCEKLLLRTKLG